MGAIGIAPSEGDTFSASAAARYLANLLCFRGSPYYYIMRCGRERDRMISTGDLIFPDLLPVRRTMCNLVLMGDENDLIFPDLLPEHRAFARVKQMADKLRTVLRSQTAFGSL
jgi:hypothetical protein